jgi:hypothetical protein
VFIRNVFLRVAQLLLYNSSNYNQVHETRLFSWMEDCQIEPDEQNFLGYEFIPFNSDRVKEFTIQATETTVLNDSLEVKLDKCLVGRWYYSDDNDLYLYDAKNFVSKLYTVGETGLTIGVDSGNNLTLISYKNVEVDPEANGESKWLNSLV